MTIRDRMLLTAAFVALAAGCAGTGSPPSHSARAEAGEQVALRVNGHPVAGSTLVLLARDMRFQGTRATVRAVVRQAVDDELVTELADRLHVTAPHRQVERAFRAATNAAAVRDLARFHIPLSHLRERLAHDALARKVIARRFRRLRARYVRDRKQFHTPLLVRVSAIQVKSALQGRTVLRLLRHGRDFDALARQFSPDPNGPDQGWKAPSRLPRRIGSALSSTPVGHVVLTPVRVRASYLVVEVTDRREPRTAPFGEVRAAIRRVVDTELRREAFLRWLRSARRSADIHYATMPDIGS
jgi:hypothetical protein